ncbi:lipoprotein [Bradyrhizobium sp. LTSP849]|uniref:septal ring lytic transglycosylase RlpA family protein n=1 Tax=unclassified Bradyrhizobium TaxID=2631580 RepID=UPI0005D14D08|nr:MULTISPECIES: septal ring lytic transglycosylase RlpA family protein [unclassified Bradyrhizobium]KJC42502.1 lipoprotein [Bradyrhizobium sp. LTSP857]KJC47199.1 lipoprotein [Bradyrhizobium sp. LTSP849]
MRALTILLLCLTTSSLALISIAHAESGLASYYGYGKAAKGGELTCAHRTRPFGSVLKVSYGGHSIQCRVNDRGPFIRGRIVDLSVPAARALGMMSAGVVRVSVE